MASEQKSLGDLLLVCLPWRRRRADSDPSPVSVHARNLNPTPPGAESPPVAATAIPLLDINLPQVDGPKWSEFKAAVGGLHAGLNMFPPLQEVVGVLFESMRHVEIANKNREGYEKLAAELVTLVETLRSHLPKTKFVGTPYSIENVARALGKLVPQIQRQQGRSTMSRVVAARDDEDDLLGCYQQMGALFQQLQMDISLSVWDVVVEGQMRSHLQYLNPVHLAYYSAGLPVEMSQRGGCTQNTRVGVLDEANSWSRDGTAPRIYWMNGMAGTGKTTIAYSLCEQLENNRQLAASFFCSRSSSDCRDVNRIVPTIAYRLAHYSHAYQWALCDLLSKEPEITRQRISVQFGKLIVEPLKKVKAAIPGDVVVAIDALDECTDVNGTKQILELLFRYASELPIKFFVTSRPEPNIQNQVMTHPDSSRSILHLHDVEQSLVEDDIRKYLVEALAPIRPASEDVDQLVAQAGRLFIFAATVVRYIMLEDAVNHRARMLTMLKIASRPNQPSYREIDKLYLAVLSRALGGELEEDEVKTRQLVLWTAVCASEPLDAFVLADILGASREDVELAIQPLRSVLHVSSKTGGISVFHASFPDFLMNSERAGDFQCHEILHHQLLAGRCFGVMTKSLKFNICELETSYKFDKDVFDLEDRAKRFISPGLFYACRYWGDHLSRVESAGDLVHSLRTFLHHQLLFWMEVLNLKGCIEHGEIVLTQVLDWIPAHVARKTDEMTGLRQLTYDARSFIVNFTASGACLSTPHLYVSVLPFTTSQSLVRSYYWPRTRGVLRATGTAIDVRGKAVLAGWSVGSGVRALARSNDGKRLVSGSEDGTISMWDVSKGTRIVGPLSGHGADIWSVALSCDGTRVASGSEDCTIRIWDAYTGSLLAGPIYGHEKGMSGLAFSPDDSRIVSGSDDHTIRMWNAHTGQPIGGLFAGHKDCVMSVVFSPDGRRIASGSDDRTIRVWDSDTGVTVVGPFVGHTGWVDCVAFSPDGLRIASSSVDRTLRVWDSYTGNLLVGPFEGHTDRVRAVAFSPNGAKLVSGSSDSTVRVWDSANGRLIAGPFEGHRNYVYAALFSADGTRAISGSTDGTICVWDAQYGTATTSKSSGHSSSIFSVAFSPDSTHAVSGSFDHTICVWDTRDGTLLSPPFTGHTGPIESVVLSPDGARIVSGSRDHTIRTWDAYTGALLAGPFEGHTDQVRSIALSPDGSRIVSASQDYTIRLWDSHTGAPVAKPLTGHTNWVNSVVFSPDGTRIASGSGDCTICMWDARGSTLPLWRCQAHDRGLLCVAFSPDGAQVASGSDDCTIMVLNALDGAVLHGPFTGHTDTVRSIGFSPDGARIVSGSGSKDCTVRIWDVQSGKLVTDPLEGHTREVNSVAFSPDGTRIMSGSTDDTIRFWDVASVEKPQGAALPFGRPPNDEGWLTDSESQLLHWLPSDLRQHFPLPHNPFVISPRGTIKADYSDLLLGERWHECYDDSNNSD